MSDMPSAPPADNPPPAAFPPPQERSRWQRVYAGRHTALTAGALDEPGALPLPAWGTFAAIAHGVLTAVVCFVAAFPAFQDARHSVVLLMATAVVAGIVEVVAAVHLREGSLGALMVVLAAAVWSLVGDVAVSGKHELDRPLVLVALGGLGLVALVGSIPEWLNAERARRRRAATEVAPPE